MRQDMQQSRHDVCDMTQRQEHSWNEWDYENRSTPVWVMMLTSDLLLLSHVLMLVLRQLVYGRPKSAKTRVVAVNDSCRSLDITNSILVSVVRSLSSDIRTNAVSCGISSFFFREYTVRVFFLCYFEWRAKHKGIDGGMVTDYASACFIHD
jgi:hypothetical protein